ncbi:MAG: hypothetical protein PHU51_01915 [Candidatus Nanoarchaeia archaeon]|nr:hypothetical protein [Candidatus Nanoarchaeia archaeon]
MVKAKKQLTRAEEFDIMKIVLDKFLLLATFIIALGFYLIIATEEYSLGFSVMASGAIVMIIFAMMLVKEYQFLGK